MTVAVLTILFIFRNEHITQSVLVNDQVKIGIKSDITIRKNRYTGNQCIFDGHGHHGHNMDIIGISY